MYDIPKHNPFRQLIPFISQHPVLLQVMIANSALHMSNARQNSPVLSMTDSFHRPPTNVLDSPHSKLTASQQPELYNDALAAKQRALCLLQSTLAKGASMDMDVVLAVVLLFIELELIDSGRDNWKCHADGARTIIKTLCGSHDSTRTPISPLRSCLISNCLVYVGHPMQLTSQPLIRLISDSTSSDHHSQARRASHPTTRSQPALHRFSKTPKATIVLRFPQPYFN